MLNGGMSRRGRGEREEEGDIERMRRKLRISGRPGWSKERRGGSEGARERKRERGGAVQCEQSPGRGRKPTGDRCAVTVRRS